MMSLAAMFAHVSMWLLVGASAVLHKNDWVDFWIKGASQPRIGGSG